MTCFALNFQPDRVALAADTVLYTPTKGEPQIAGFTSKVYPLPHLRAVVFGRGQAEIVSVAATRLGLTPGITTIEDAAGVLPGVLEEIATRYSLLSGIEDHTAFVMSEVFLVGWSEADQRMRLLIFQNFTSWRPFEDDGGQYRLWAIPPIPDEEMPPESAPADLYLASVVKRCAAYYATRPEGQIAIGGDLQLWELTPASIGVRVIDSIPVARASNREEADDFDLSEQLCRVSDAIFEEP